MAEEKLLHYHLPVGKNNGEDDGLDIQNKIIYNMTAEHIASIKLKPDSVVADIGCGNGTVVNILTNYVSTIYAIDSSTEQLEKTRININRDNITDVNIMYVNLDIRKYNRTLDNMFDMIFVRMVMIYVESNKIDNVVSNLISMLKPGGYIVCEEPIWNNIRCSYCPEVFSTYFSEIIERKKIVGLDYNMGLRLGKIFGKPDTVIVSNYESNNKCSVPDFKYLGCKLADIHKNNYPGKDFDTIYNNLMLAINTMPEDDDNIECVVGTFQCVTVKKL